MLNRYRITFKEGVEINKVLFPSLIKLTKIPQKIAIAFVDQVYAKVGQLDGSLHLFDTGVYTEDSDNGFLALLTHVKESNLILYNSTLVFKLSDLSDEEQSRVVNSLSCALNNLMTLRYWKIEICNTLQEEDWKR